MPIIVQCSCGQAFEARDDLAGRRVACPMCQQPLVIPARQAGGELGIDELRPVEPQLASLPDPLAIPQQNVAGRAPAHHPLHAQSYPGWPQPARRRRKLSLRSPLVIWLFAVSAAVVLLVVGGIVVSALLPPAGEGVADGDSGDSTETAANPAEPNSPRASSAAKPADDPAAHQRAEAAAKARQAKWAQDHGVEIAGRGQASSMRGGCATRR